MFGICTKKVSIQSCELQRLAQNIEILNAASEVIKTFLRAKNGGDQAVQMFRLICAIVVCMQQNHTPDRRQLKML